MPEKDLFDVTGKAAIVTGASRGLGRAFAEVLAEYGADVACIGRDQSKLKETIDIISSFGNKAVSIAADVSNQEDVKRMVDQTVKEFGKVDILINNAGIAGVNYKIHEMPVESWDDVMNANLKSQFLCIREVIPHMLKNNGGSIVNISSNAGLRGDGNMIPPTYGVSKAGIISLTEYAALQYVRDNIRVNAIAPGMHKSNLGHPDDADQSKQLDKAIEEFCSNSVPMGRQADAAELKGLIILLASNASSFITGQVFVQDGGQITQL